jgi:hypothetical protein
LLSLIVIVEPGSPLPLIVVPLVGLTTGADGDVVAALLTVVDDGVEGASAGLPGIVGS